jgi:MYXO-CTERM domain-containing protein
MIRSREPRPIGLATATLVALALVLASAPARIAHAQDATDGLDAAAPRFDGGPGVDVVEEDETVDGGAADASDVDADQPPVGIQPTTTPDNLGCRAAPGPDVPSGALPATALVVLAAGLGLRTQRQRKPVARPGRDQGGPR